MTTLAASESEHPSNPTGFALLTFLIADVRGYTRFTNEHGDEAAALLADRFAQLCEEILGAHEGHVIELRGDEALAVFSSARQALRGAVALQQAFKESMRTDPSLPLQVGMGLDAGEAIPVRGGYRGGALNLAARLCSVAGAGEILASETVIGLARKTEGLTFVDRGQVTLKGLRAPVRVLQIAPEGELPAELSPLQPILVNRPTNLPDDPTPFVGREDEIAAISALVRDPHIRLVTLTGPGGTGKTRLALQVGNTLLYDFSDGVFVCDLSPLADPALVPSTVADLLGLKEEAGRSVAETLTEHLRRKHLLLVLDNFEHLMDACSLVSGLLDACRSLHILVTSRIPLHLSREQEYPVRPLPVPDIEHLPDPKGLSQFESVALFLQRASAVKPGFAVNTDNAPAVAEICVRLDGLPLAIELAAARVKLLPPQALLQRLDNRLKVLTGGSRDKPTRQQTLRGTIDWSYSLLTEEEQTLFARLSVFAAGWSFEAAEAVCNPEGELDLFEGMASLVDKSLVRQEGEDEPRFSMLETIHEYGRERAGAGRTATAGRELHAEHFLRLARHAEQHMFDSEQQYWLQRLETEHANLRAALDYLIAAARFDRAGELASALWIFWWNYGHLREGRQRLEQVVASSDVVGPARVRSLTGAASLAMLQGDLDSAARLFEDCLTYSRTLGDKRELVRALTWSIDLPLFYSGRHEHAALLIEECIRLAREVDDHWALAMATANEGVAAANAGDHSRARQRYETALDGLHAAGDTTRIAWLTFALAMLDLEEGAFAEAETGFHEALRLAQELAHIQGMVETLDCCACVEACFGRFDKAAELWGAVDTLRRRFGLTSQTAQGTLQPVIERARTETITHLGRPGWERAFTRGSALSLDEAVALATTGRKSQVSDLDCRDA